MTRPVPIQDFMRVVRPMLLRPVLGIVLVAIISYGIAWLIPRWYAAETTLLPPDETGDSFGILASMIEASALSKVGLVSSTSASDVFEEILKSRRVREPLVESYSLRKRYGVQNLDLCLKEFDSHVKTDVLRSHVLVLKVEDRDPKIAAALANDLIVGLDRVYRETRSQKARGAREFLEGQLEDAERRLKVAETRLTQYERTHDVLGGMEGAAVQGAAEILAWKLALQVRRTWMESYSGRESPALQTVNSELSALDREIGRLPGLKQEAARLSLEVEIQRRVYTLLTAQFEEARLEEARTISSISVLDPARAPTVHSRPRRLIIVAVSAGLFALLAGIWVVPRARRELEKSGVLVG